MKKITQEQINEVKGLGFLINRSTNTCSGRIVPCGTVFSAQNFADIAKLSSVFGNGKVFATSRLSIEVPGIPYHKIKEAISFANEHNLRFGGTGNKIRPITACKGTTCVYGNCDTQDIAKQIHEKYYIGWKNVKLPHKFKIGVGGCPNSCMKPSLNDFGIEGHKTPVCDKTLCKNCTKCIVETRCPTKAAQIIDDKINIDSSKCISCGICVGKCPFGAIANESNTEYKIFVGGTWGKTTRIGTPLSFTVKYEDLFSILEKSIIWFKLNAKEKERFGVAINRVGFEKFEQDIINDNLLSQKDKLFE